MKLCPWIIDGKRGEMTSSLGKGLLRIGLLNCSDSAEYVSLSNLSALNGPYMSSGGKVVSLSDACNSAWRRDVATSEIDILPEQLFVISDQFPVIPSWNANVPRGPGENTWPSWHQLGRIRLWGFALGSQPEAMVEPQRLNARPNLLRHVHEREVGLTLGTRLRALNERAQEAQVDPLPRAAVHHEFALPARKGTDDLGSESA